MAELAFETIIRVFIAVIVLGLVSVVLSTLFTNLEEKVEVELNKELELPVVVEASSLKAKDFEAYASSCREYFKENVPTYRIETCFVFKEANYNEIEKINSSFVEVKNTYTNAIMSYDVYNDKVIIE